MPAGSSIIVLCRNRVSGGSPFIGLIGHDRWGLGSWVDVVVPEGCAACCAWTGAGGSTGVRCGGAGRRGGSSRNPLFIGGRGRCGGGGGGSGRGGRRLVSTSLPVRYAA